MRRTQLQDTCNPATSAIWRQPSCTGVSCIPPSSNRQQHLLATELTDSRCSPLVAANAACAAAPAAPPRATRVLPLRAGRRCQVSHRRHCHLVLQEKDAQVSSTHLHCTSWCRNPVTTEAFASSSRTGTVLGPAAQQLHWRASAHESTCTNCASRSQSISAENV